MPTLQDRQKAAAVDDLAQLLKLRPPAQVTWDGDCLIVDAAGQALPDRPTVWAGAHRIIYRHGASLHAPDRDTTR